MALAKHVAAQLGKLALLRRRSPGADQPDWAKISNIAPATAFFFSLVPPHNIDPAPLFCPPYESFVLVSRHPIFLRLHALLLPVPPAPTC